MRLGTPLLQDYTNAKIDAQKVLEKRNILQDLNLFSGEEFLNASSSELIFSMGAASIPENIAVNSSCASNHFQVSNDLYNCYEEGDLRTKFYIEKEGFEKKIRALLDEIQSNIFKKALDFRQNNIREANSWDEFKELLEKEGGFISAHWDGTAETEEKIKEETKATIRLIPLNNNKEEGKCVYSGKTSKERVIFAKAY